MGWRCLDFKGDGGDSGEKGKAEHIFEMLRASLFILACFPEHILEPIRAIFHFVGSWLSGASAFTPIGSLQIPAT